MKRSNRSLVLANAVHFAGCLRAVMICVLTLSLIAPAVSAHADHQVLHPPQHLEFVENDAMSSDEAGQTADIDCSVHPGCHVLALLESTTTQTVFATSEVFCEHRKQFFEFADTPLPHPPNFS